MLFRSVKNKVAPPFAEAEFDILFNHGIDKEGSILDCGLEAGVLDKKGSWIQYGGDLIGQGKEAARKTLVEKPDVARKIKEAVVSKKAAELAATNAPATPAPAAPAKA